MKIAVRSDASSEIGTGHLRRCLSIAEALEALGAEVRFVVRRHDAVAEQVLAATHRVIWLPGIEGEPDLAVSPPHAAWARVLWQRDLAETAGALRAFAPDWVIVDHYAFDAQWHEGMRSLLGCSILAVDDLGDRPLAADILLDGNAARSHADKYADRLRRPGRMLAGPRFAPLSPAYREAPRYRFSSEVASIGIFLGGTDPQGVSAQVLDTLRHEAGFAGRIELVSTSANAQLAALARLCDADGEATLSIDLPELSRFYAQHDLHIGAGGTSSYERCCIGAPTISMVLAANQLAVVPILEDLGVVRSAFLLEVEATRLLPGGAPLAAVVRELLADTEQRRRLSEASQQLVDGRGAERVALALLADRMRLRPASTDDAAMLHAWRNDPATRSVSIDTRKIALADHLRWLEAVLAAPSRKLFVATIAGKPVGVIRFDLLDGGAWEVSLYLDPSLHGLGLGKRLLLDGERALCHTGDRPIEFRAQVVPGNVASMTLFQSAGYAGDLQRLVKIRQPGNSA